jgi:hypothetical protein
LSEFGNKGVVFVLENNPINGLASDDLLVLGKSGAGVVLEKNPAVRLASVNFGGFDISDAGDMVDETENSPVVGLVFVRI